MLVAAGSAWWARRTADGPAWVRRLPAEIRDDPVRRREALRTAWQTRAWLWALLAFGIGGIAWAVTVQHWGALVWSIVISVAITRVLWRTYRPPPKSPPA